MILEELLDQTRKEYLDDYADLLDGDPDQLWSDDVMVRHFNEAQRILCRRSWVLTEYAKAPAGIITLVANKSVYDLHKSIIRVIHAIPSDSELRLARVNEEVLVTRPMSDPEQPFDINVAETTDPGYPRAIATDAGNRKLRVYPAPSSTEVTDGLKLYLKVVRRPITYLTLDNTNAEPEVPEDWHESLCKYAAGKCATSPKAGDVDLKVQGRTWLAEFAEDVRLARQERQRTEAAPIQFKPQTITAYI